MADTYYYISAYADEIMPCGPTLDDWAAWLDMPAPDWGRPSPAADGEVFEAFSLRLLDNVTARFADDVWTFEDPPAETETVFVRCGDEDSGWSVDDSAYFAPNFGECPDRASILAAVTNAWARVDEGDTCACLLACIATGENLEIRFNRTPDGPRCYVVSQVGRA